MSIDVFYVKVSHTIFQRRIVAGSFALVKLSYNHLALELSFVMLYLQEVK